MSSAQPHRDYSHVPLAKKLGLVSTKGTVGEVALLAEPEGFREELGELEGVSFQKRLRPSTALALCFVRTARDLAAMVEMLAGQLPAAAHVWIIRPKTHLKPEIGETEVREAGLNAGFVDYKVCSVNQDWSGLKFARRKQG